MSEAIPTYSIDDVFEALADIHRRELLVSVLIQTQQADTVVFDAKPYGESFDEVSYTEMYHIHLPKLADCGFIEWNREELEITEGPNFDEIRPLLELLNGHEEELPHGWLDSDTVSG